jgi:uncharacterized protein GlcG (DUF336 family)
LNSDQNAFFVAKLYPDLLNRPADPGAQSTFTSMLNRAEITRSDLALGIESSPEYRNHQTASLFTQYLHRGATSQDLLNAFNFRSAGGTVEQLIANLAGSLEYFQNRDGSTNAGFLSALFQDALGRAIKSGGLAFFGSELTAGLSRTQVALQILSSAEYQAKLITLDYGAFLHRAPEPGAIAAFTSLLQQGKRDEDIIASLVSSEEYAPGATDYFLAKEEVTQLLDRAAGATASDDAIVAVVDRGGHLLGLRVESGVSPVFTGNAAALIFAVDGALAEARTGAFFASDQAPLTSRTIQFISQSTITQREVESNPSVSDNNSPLRGPGFVAPVGLGGHFPPNIANTPPVDLFGIEHTNRDSIRPVGPDHIKGTADDIALPDLPARFNINPAFFGPGVNNDNLTPPESYGLISGMNRYAQARGIGTLPGGTPLYKNGELVGGIGVFFPGATGFATAENSSLSATYNPAMPDRSLEAEYIAFAAAGGSSGAGASIGTIAGIAPLPGFDLPFGRIDLAGITLPLYGPGTPLQGPSILVQIGMSLGTGNPFSGSSYPIMTGQVPHPATDPVNINTRDGVEVPEGWLVMPHAGGNLTQADVAQIILQGINEANKTRAQIRLPIGVRTKMSFAVTDSDGNVLGLYRMHDGPVFSLDVAVAKARNAAYYDDPSQLLTVDQIPVLPKGVAFTARTFRYLAQPRFPEGIDGTPPAPFSILNDPGIDPRTGLDNGPRLPASVYTSVYGFDSFNPNTNFRQANSGSKTNNQNGVVFFPGSSVLYKVVSGALVPVGGLGTSGDGVDQDDFVTAAAVTGYGPPPAVRADVFFVGGVRLPYFRFPRNPES